MHVPTPESPYSYSDVQELLPPVPRPGFAVTPPAAELPGFDPSQSPLAPGGRPDSPQPLTTRSRLIGLTMPHMASKPRVVYRVRREGWVSRRSQARSRFASIHQAEGPSTPRILRHLIERGGKGILGRKTGGRAEPRLDIRRK